MVVDHPSPEQIPALQRLWQQVFEDTTEFIRLFFSCAYAPDHCLCLVKEQPVAALYWLDCHYHGEKYAYLYAVATHPEHRGKGFCRQLMEKTHRLLAHRGYTGALLVPQTPELREMYGKMGYRDCTCVTERFCAAGEKTVPIRPVQPQEYADLRRQYLPDKGVIQEFANLSLLSGIAKLYAGEDFILAAAQQKDALWGMELLGNPDAAPAILRSLGYGAGTFRTPGTDQRFAMLLPLNPNAEAPEYFGLAFD